MRDGLRRRARITSHCPRRQRGADTRVCKGRDSSRPSWQGGLGAPRRVSAQQTESLRHGACCEVIIAWFLRTPDVVDSGMSPVPWRGHSCLPGRAGRRAPPAPPVRSLAADHHVRAALNHVAGAPAVLVAIVQTVRLQVVDRHRLAARHRHPRIGSATLRVGASVADAQRRTVVDAHVGRSRLGRAHANVRATRTFMMIVRGHPGIIAEPRLRLHCMLGNIAQVAVGRSTFWR